MIEQSKKYIVVGNKSWNKEIFETTIKLYPGKWFYFDSMEDLSDTALKQISPRYIFYLHWSAFVPDRITDSYECVCFHMTDVPYGRGGSPLQNLILRGHKNTKLTALRMVHDLDAGPVYAKQDLNLDGSAHDIYVRSSHLAADMIKEIIAAEPIPNPQEGKPIIFKRRSPKQSKIPSQKTLESFYDFIRMLDAEGYPQAYIEYKGYKIRFQKATLHEKQIISEVIITKNGDTQ